MSIVPLDFTHCFFLYDCTKDCLEILGGYILKENLGLCQRLHPKVERGAVAVRADAGNCDIILREMDSQRKERERGERRSELVSG